MGTLQRDYRILDVNLVNDLLGGPRMNEIRHDTSIVVSYERLRKTSSKKEGRGIKLRK